MEKNKMQASRYTFINKQSASNKMPRQINRNLIFNQIRVRQPVSRADLARTSGLQRSTVSLIVEELLAERWIVEGSMGRLPRGRRPTFLNLNSQRGVLALDIHPEQTTIAVTDLGGKILAEKLIVLPKNAEKVIGAIVDSIREMIAAHADRIFDGIGISLPGRFDLDLDKSVTDKSRSDKSGAGRSRSDSSGGKKSVFAPNISWPIGGIKSRVEQATGLPVVVDNVANACALSEVWFGSSDGLHDLVVVNVSEGLGTGIFANGRILRGEGGSAGEFGHVQVDPNGLPCGCGSNGCWETVASNRAGMRYYHEIASKPSPAFETLLELAEAGDPAAREAIEKMCAALGRGMHMIASALAPSEIVVVGDIANSWHFAGSLIESAMRRNPLVRVPRLRPALEAGKARLRSAVALIMNENSL